MQTIKPRSSGRVKSFSAKTLVAFFKNVESNKTYSFIILFQTFNPVIHLEFVTKQEDETYFLSLFLKNYHFIENAYMTTY